MMSPMIHNRLDKRVALIRLVMTSNQSDFQVREETERWRRIVAESTKDLPLIRYREKAVTVDHYFCATYIAAAYRGHQARLEVATLRAERRAMASQWTPAPSPEGNASVVRQGTIIAASAIDESHADSNAISAAAIAQTESPPTGGVSKARSSATGSPSTTPRRSAQWGAPTLTEKPSFPGFHAGKSAFSPVFPGAPSQ